MLKRLKKLNKIYFVRNLFIYFQLLWVFVAAHGLSLVAASGGYSLLWCTGFSVQWLHPLPSMGYRHMGFSSCGTRAQLLRSMWDLPEPGIEPVSPALAGGLLTTAPPGKFPKICFIGWHWWLSMKRENSNFTVEKTSSRKLHSRENTLIKWPSVRSPVMSCIP